MTFLGVAPTPDIDDVSQPDRVFLEGDTEQVVFGTIDGTIKYFYLKLTGGQQIVLVPVTLKPGPRAAAPAEEIVEIVAGPDTVGSAEVEV